MRLIIGYSFEASHGQWLVIDCGYGGTKYKVVPKIDQSAMYAAVHQGLGEGQCLGIFPEACSCACTLGMQ